MREEIQTQTPVGHLVDKIPIRQGEGIVKKEAETMCIEINNAYNFLVNLYGNPYSEITEKIKEIRIVKTVVDEELNYDLICPDGDKAILRLKNKTAYVDIIYSFISAGGELLL